MNHGHSRIKVWSFFTVAKLERHGMTAGNADIVANMNSFAMLTSRSHALSCVKR